MHIVHCGVLAVVKPFSPAPLLNSLVCLLVAERCEVRCDVRMAS
jgi:hypothetical protein